jgi:uncharacterized membrane protein
VRSLAVALAGGLLLGGIIHIAIVFLVPVYASNDAYSRMTSYGTGPGFHLLPEPGAGLEALTSLDPRMVHATCPFDLANGPLHISAGFPDVFWSVAIFDRRGRNVYSLNDRSADRSRLEMAVINPVQMALLRQNPPALLESAIVVEHALTQGFALLRIFVPDEASPQAARAALLQATCSPLQTQ